MAYWKAENVCILQAYLGGIEGQALDGLQKGLDGVIAGGTCQILGVLYASEGMASCVWHLVR